MNIVVLGSPGVGKGTYTQALVNIIHFPHVSTGDLFRQLAAQGNPLGVKARDQYWAKGILVPDDITISLVRERLSQPDCRKGFILDGFPRTVAQAEALELIAPIDIVIYYLADDNIIIHRLSGRIICRACGKIYHATDLLPRKEGVCDLCDGELYHRPDDNPKTIQDRLDFYRRETFPLIEFYRRKGKLREINANEDFGTYREMILGRIMDALNSVKPVMRL